MERETACPHCRRPADAVALTEAAWLPEPVRSNLGRACPTCAQRALHGWLLGRIADGGAHGCSPFEDGRLIPFGVVPAAMQLGHDYSYTGQGVTVAMVDSGFFPHPDLTGLPEDHLNGNWRLRVRAWADTSSQDIKSRYFHPFHPPRWPGWSKREARQWHGMMTAAAAVGNGRSSRGWYKGFAPDADVVFVQTWDPHNRITNASIVRALRWLLKHRERLRLRVVNLSVRGDPVKRLKGNRVDVAVRRLVEAGVVVVAAAGNAGRRELLPPATSIHAITVGGADLRNSSDPAAWKIWHGNWGLSGAGTPKPDLLAPGLWVAAPVLPGSMLAAEAEALFALRDGNPEVETRIAAEKLISPRFQHVDGSSFAAAIVSGVVACMLEARPDLTPDAVRSILATTARPLPDVACGRQGAGVIQPRLALEALR